MPSSGACDDNQGAEQRGHGHRVMRKADQPNKAAHKMNGQPDSNGNTGLTTAAVANTSMYATGSPMTTTAIAAKFRMRYDTQAGGTF